MVNQKNFLKNLISGRFSLKKDRRRDIDNEGRICRFPGGSFIDPTFSGEL
jgi:hypothetical protein